jgi:crooked neck
MAFVKFELRYNEFDLARKVYQRFVTAFPLTKNWLKWAKFEEQNNNIGTRISFRYGSTYL